MPKDSTTNCIYAQVHWCKVSSKNSWNYMQYRSRKVLYICFKHNELHLNLTSDIKLYWLVTLVICACLCARPIVLQKFSVGVIEHRTFMGCSFVSFLNGIVASFGGREWSMREKKKRSFKLPQFVDFLVCIMKEGKELKTRIWGCFPGWFDFPSRMEFERKVQI